MATGEGAPPPRSGSVRVGSELWRTFGGIHTTRMGAHREHFENSMSAGAATMELNLLPAARLDADEEQHKMLTIFTDTFIDLSVALDIGHGKDKDEDETTVHGKGVLNNFGIGLKCFQASLGLQTQVAIYTYKKQAFGEEVMAAARMGSALDQHFANLNSGNIVHISNAIAAVKRGADGDVHFDWAGDSGTREAFLGAKSPWLSEPATLGPMRELLRKVAAAGSSRGTLFVYHTDGSEELPYRVVVNVVDDEEDEGGEGSAHAAGSHNVDDDVEMTIKVEAEPYDDAEEVVPAAEVVSEVEEVLQSVPLEEGRLEVKNMDGVWSDVAKALELSYIDDDTEPLEALARAEGAPLPRAPKLPRVSVQGHLLSFDRHAWCAEQQRSGTKLGEYFPVRLHGVATPIAYARCCHMDLEEYYRRGSTMGPRLWLNKQNLDGAFFVMHGHKAVNEQPGQLFDGTAFEEATTGLNKFTALAKHNSDDFQRAKYDLLKEYLSAGCDESSAAPLPPELQYEALSKIKPKKSHLWPHLGYGVLAVVHLHPDFFALDRKKTKVIRRDCDHMDGITTRQLVSAVRTSLAEWAATHRAPELPQPRKNPVPRAPRPRQLVAADASTSANGAGASSSSAVGGPGEELVGQYISVYWSEVNDWFDGQVDKYDGERADGDTHYVIYDDGDEQWERLIPSNTNDPPKEHGEYIVLKSAGDLPEKRRKKSRLDYDDTSQLAHMQPMTVTKRAARSSKAVAKAPAHQMTELTAFKKGMQQAALPIIQLGAEVESAARDNLLDELTALRRYKAEVEKHIIAKLRK